MKIVVPVKAVAALDDEFELPDDGAAVDPDYLEWDLNEWDSFSVEAALELREAAGEGEVIVVTVGDDGCRGRALSCLAKGADRGVRIWDDELEGADPLAVARVLAAAVGASPRTSCSAACSHRMPSTAPPGSRSRTSSTSPMSRWSSGSSYDRERDATVERELEGGLIEVLRVALPALLTVQTGINQPRYATLRAIKQARDKPLPRSSLDELGLERGRGRGRRRLAAARARVPDRSAGAQMLEGSTAEMAAGSPSSSGSGWRDGRASSWSRRPAAASCARSRSS